MTFKQEDVRSGTIVVEWTVRKSTFEDGTVAYDWIADNARGNYDESDEAWDTLQEALDDLGVA